MVQLYLVDGWRTDQRRRGLLPSSIERRSAMVTSLARWLDGGHLAEVTEETLQKFLDGRRNSQGQSISSRTRYSWISGLHCFYSWALRAHGDLFKVDPTADIIRPKLRKTLPRPISDADLAMALELAPVQIKAWLVLAAYAGLRCAEIASLHRDDVILDAARLRVVGKGQKERLVPMHARVLAVMEEYPMPRRNGPIFTRPSGGGWPPALLSRTGSVFLHDVGIDATMHQLRHWFGTRTYRVSKDIRVVQELLGHSSPTTTAIYTAFSNEDSAAAVDGLV